MGASDMAEQFMEEDYEMILGEKVIKDYTTTFHNSIISELVYQIKDHIKKNNKKCELFHERVALYCSEISRDFPYSFFEPDIMVICDVKEGTIKEDGVYTAPDYVCEVTSPSTMMHDYNQKKKVYQKIGVKEYWIIDPERRQATIHLLEDNYFGELVSLDEPVMIRTGGFEIDLHEVFQG